MTALFYAAAGIAVAATALAITSPQAVHALLYLVVSLLAVAAVFVSLGAPFAAAVQVIVYAGAIMVLFVFVVILLNPGRDDAARERRWQSGLAWLGPALLALVLGVEVLFALAAGPEPAAAAAAAVGPRETASTLLGPYLLGVEIASLLLLSGMLGTLHLGRRTGRGGPA
ncbi:MAG TPA: NADH-quinone oxidoreductase subunit J [Candidatus Polarisedimenticolia bacterium]|nr:NADH-quinone oxidoreductase subunit J [Candidatus Polarisedimenticolia bacterium]